MVGDIRIGHDRRGVGVHQHDLDAFLLQRFAGLRARVVKLRRLANHDRTGADDQDLLDARVQRHGGQPLGLEMISVLAVMQICCE